MGMVYRGLIYFVGLNTASGNEFDRKVKALQASHTKRHKLTEYVSKKTLFRELMKTD